MERKLRNATSKLRNLKDFLSSTRSLSQHNQGQSSSSHAHSHYHQKHVNSRKNSHVSNVSGSGEAGRSNLSVSLFDLVDPPLCSSRPTSMAFSGHSYGSGQLAYNSSTQPTHQGSVSMYGLAIGGSSGTLGDEGYGARAEGDQAQASSVADTRPTVLSSKNPALRLFYTIRSKFRRRKRDRINKIVDSKSTNDFGTPIPISKTH